MYLYLSPSASGRTRTSICPLISPPRDERRFNACRLRGRDAAGPHPFDPVPERAPTDLGRVRRAPDPRSRRAGGRGAGNGVAGRPAPVAAVAPPALCAPARPSRRGGLEGAQGPPPPFLALSGPAAARGDRSGGPADRRLFPSRRDR